MGISKGYFAKQLFNLSNAFMLVFRGIIHTFILIKRGETSMVKIIIGILSLVLSINMTYAGQYKKISNHVKFDSTFWSSTKAGDDVRIEGPTDSDSQYAFVVQISPERDDPYLTGINVQNCGNITHIDAGSSAICMLTYKNHVIIFSSDKDNMSAHGLYQIEKNL
jgi:hypothetical protein